MLGVNESRLKDDIETELHVLEENYNYKKRTDS